ncbi:MAG: DsbE family thiol:disulfide interchange protein [Paracoccus sp. (in: a-proteobacteria)]|uniref:DsbE family thiol:disulfide interchange protein n=1 Tax=Paracoccus sp. TaxID=267 RepID=UPI0026E0BD31|nr:DsbE family thiol:disulfide interchange protein [Paracoccus sp. (in: a-proteobacteria)]MDO5633158.1 DsbE family thiol:disulfide interchange protein [Paracoccus sp. (in: a-proteobacteria)]
MAKVSPMMLLPPAIFAGLAALFLWGMGRDDPNALPSTFIGQPAPEVPQTTLPGKVQLTDEMLRQPGVKLVNFWASWCPPCRAEHPTLTELAKTIPVYGIDLKDPQANALRFLEQDGDPFHALATDPNGRGAIEWGVTAPPETFILDGEGRVLYRHAGPLIRDDYTQRFLPQLERALADE